MIKFVSLDLETSGFQEGAEVLELGVTYQHGAVFTCWSRMFGNERPIPPAARAVHHIWPEDLVGLQTFAVHGAHAMSELVPEDAEFVVAHSAEYEQRYLGQLVRGLPWVCTYKAALRVWPEAPTHSNAGLMYWLMDQGLWVDNFSREMSVPTHRAAPDSYITACLCRVLLQHATLEQLIQWTREPRYITRVPFGDSKGKLFSEVDEGLLHWILRRDFDADVMAAANRELDRRIAERERLEHERQAPLFLGIDQAGSQDLTGYDRIDIWPEKP